jgi:hypothetical protein
MILNECESSHVERDARFSRVGMKPRICPFDLAFDSRLGAQLSIAATSRAVEGFYRKPNVRSSASASSPAFGRPDPLPPGEARKRAREGMARRPRL